LVHRMVAFLRKKPLECLLSAKSNSESAIAGSGWLRGSRPSKAHAGTQK